MSKYDNIRLIREPVFQVNSSSNHYFFWSHDRTQYSDDFNDHFGWSGHVASEVGKILYAANVALNWAVCDKSEEEAKKAVETVFAGFGIPLATHEAFKDWDEFIVDHQSVPGRKVRWDKTDWALFRDYFFWVMQTEVSICLSNDNGGSEYLSPPKNGWMKDADYIFDLEEIKRFHPMVKVFPRDENGNPTGFQAVAKKTGTYGISFGEEQQSEVPEAIDVKITDKCNKGCKFCYQSSRSDGIHASHDNLTDLAREMSRAGVLQVALGGGEPTLWKDGSEAFCNVVYRFSLHSIMPSFSTGSLDWVDSGDSYGLEQILEVCGGIAYSVTSAEEARAWVEAVGRMHTYQKTVDLPQFSANVIPEYLSNGELTEIVKILGKEGIHILFLGAKNCGDAKNLNQELNKEWTDVLETAKLFKIILSADSVIAEHYPELFAERGPGHVPTEGDKTMYVDAVEWKSGRCSFDDNLEEIQGCTWEDIAKNFPYGKEKRAADKGWVTLDEFLGTGRDWVLLEVKPVDTLSVDYLWVDSHGAVYALAKLTTEEKELVSVCQVILDPNFSFWPSRLVRPLPPGVVVHLPFGTVPEDEGEEGEE